MYNSNTFTLLNYSISGDFGQLPPVKDRIIWEKSYLDGRNDLAPNHWNENFSIYYLTEKMRSQDKEFSQISDKVRKGVCDSEVLKFMKEHVNNCPSENENDEYKYGKLAIIVTTNKDRDLINLEKLNKLLPIEKTYQETCVDESINSKTGPKVPEHLPHTQTGQLETNFIFKQNAPVMITSNHPQQRYKNNGIVNGSRGYIDSIQVSKDNTNEVEIIWVRFNDDKTGQLLRQDNLALLKHHKPNDPKAVPIRKQKKPFQPMGGNSSVVRTQFPLTLCYALTAHKCQGQTLEQVIVDFTGARKNDAGSFYTAMSRVRNGKSLYLRDFKPEYISANELVERQMKSMKISVPYTFKKFYLDVNMFEKPDNEVKVGYVNINCLYHSRSDIFLNNDDNLLCLDYLAVADTRLTKNHSNADLKENLNNWKILHRFDAGDSMTMKHMGLLLLKSRRSTIVSSHEEVKAKEWRESFTDKDVVLAQQLLLIVDKLKITFFYVREKPTLKDIERFNKTIQNSNIILGDFNLNPNDDKDHKRLAALTGNDKTRVLHELTYHTYNHQLDHIFLDTNLYPEHFCTSYNNHTTDHKVITIRLPLNGNKFSEQFKENVNFDNEKWTRKTKHNNFQDDENDEAFTSDEDVLDRYIELLNNIHPKRKVFYSDFFEKIKKVSYENISSNYKDLKIIEAEEVFILIQTSNLDYCLVHWTTGLLTLYQKSSNENIENYHQMLKLLSNLKTEYIDRLFESFEMPIPHLSLYTDTFPSCEMPHDDLVNILTFLKHKLYRLTFELKSSKLSKERKNIFSEVKANKIFPISKKRKGVTFSETPDPKITKRTFRSFRNPDMESCWINSCMQLVLAALDHSNDISPNGSVLWETLQSLQSKDFDDIINPLEVRDIMIEKELERIMSKKIAPENRLFHFAGSTSNNQKSLKQLSEKSRLGQQDCKDFFIGIQENNQHWLDLYGVFKFSLTRKTTCGICGIDQQAETSETHSFLMLEPPQQDITLNDYLDQHLNKSSDVHGWRHQDGCGIVTTGSHSLRIVNINSVQFLTIIVNRLELNGFGIMTINDKKIDVTSEIRIKGDDSTEATFKPISVIHHIGHVTGKDTRGHYMADVFDVKSSKWFRTSDDDLPKVISTVTDNGYIYLLKKQNL